MQEDLIDLAFEGITLVVIGTAMMFLALLTE